MKYFFFLIILLTCINFSLFAQEEGEKKTTIDVTVFAGVPLPYLPEEFSDVWEQDKIYGMGFGFNFPEGDLGYSTIYVTMERTDFSFDSARLADWKSRKGQQWIVNGGDLSVNNFFLDYKGTFSQVSSVIAPYFMIGLGLQATANSAATFRDSSGKGEMGLRHEMSVAWRSGVGVDIPLSNKWTIFGDAKYIVGVERHQYFTIVGGLRLRW